MSHRFTEKFTIELDAFFAMRENIPSFDDELPKLKKNAEHLNNLAKLVSDDLNLSMVHIFYSLFYPDE